MKANIDTGKEIDKKLTGPEKKASVKYFGKGFRSTVKRLNAIRKIYNKLCRDCQLKAFNAGLQGGAGRMEVLGNLETYCDTCKPMIEKILERVK